MLHDKKGRKIEVNDTVLRVTEGSLRSTVTALGRRYVTVQAEDGHKEEKILPERLVIIKQVDGEWVDDWDRPRPAPGRRIAWGKSNDIYEIYTGYISRIPIFSITLGTHKGVSTRLLACSLPGYTSKKWPVENHAAGEELAEKLWVSWLKAMGAAPVEKENGK